MAYIGKTPTVGNFQVCDAISVVNGQAAYTLQVGGVNVAPESANHMLVSLNGILQKPGSSFTISGSTMTFASNLATGDVIDFVQILGNVLDLGQPSDDTVTAAKLNNDVISGQTALTSSPDDTDELLISDAGTIKRIDVSLIGGKNTPNFLVSKSGSQSLDNDAYTKITFDVENIDSDNAFASNKFTAPSAGTYYFNATVLVRIGQTTTNWTAIYKNGSAFRLCKRYRYGNDTSSHTEVAEVIAALNANDYIEVYHYTNIGASVNRDVFGNNTADLATTFSGFKLIT